MSPLKILQKFKIRESKCKCYGISIKRLWDNLGRIDHLYGFASQKKVEVDTKDRGTEKGGGTLKKRDKVIIGALSIVGLLIVGLWGVDTTGFISVTEVISDPQYIGTDVQVKGIIKDGTVHADIGGISFELTDNEATILVEYAGDRPISPIPGGEAVVIGKVISDEKIIARQVIVGCAQEMVGRPPTY